MRILALESSAKAVSAAICEDGRLIAQSYQNSGLTHSRTLLPLVEDMLKNTELGYGDIDLVAVAKGPGSFTGIRIGVAAAKGIAWARELPLAGVSTLEAMAHQLSCFEGVICAVMDARRSEVYNALFEMREGKLSRLCEDRAIPLSELLSELRGLSGEIILVGDGADISFKFLSEAGLNVRRAPENLKFQTAWGVAAAAAEKESGTASELRPVYLRLSQAERERLAKG